LLQAVEDISSTKKRLRIEIPSDVIEKEIENSLEKVRQKTNLPGFRPGKAPMNLIERRFGKKVEAEVLEKVIPEFYGKALKEADLKPVAMPVLDEQFTFQRNSPLNLSLTVEVMPKIENLDYAAIKAKDVHVVVDEAELENALKNLQEQKALYQVAEKEIEKDDLVTFDYVDCELVEGETTPSLREEVLKLGNKLLPKNIEEKLIGRKKGDTVEFTTSFEEDFKVKELVGKALQVKIMINEVKHKVLPAIDDEFAKDVGYASISELNEKIKENLYQFKKDQATKIQKAEIVRQLIESNDFEIPETLLNNELDSLIMEESISVKRSGKLEEAKRRDDSGSVEAISEVNKPDLRDQSEEEIRSALKENSALKEKALRNVRASILIRAIGQKEGITVTEDEVGDRISVIAKRLSAQPEAVMNFYRTKDGSLEGLRQMIFEDKVLDLLFSRATIEKGE
jgi:trigger factor